MAKNKGPKVYAVRVGRKPGVYSTWDECSAQVNGFPGAEHKSFKTYQEAEQFVSGGKPQVAALPKPGRFYGIAGDGKSRVTETWDEAQEIRKTVPGGIVQKFDSRSAAEEFAASSATNTGKKRSLEKAAISDEVDEDAEDEEKLLKPASKKAKTVLEIYTDGACRGNGQPGSRAGVGVWFGRNSKKNLAEPLLGEPQTNQRAELTAILRALQTADYIGPIRIISDSDYSIRCCTQWYKNWETNNWRTRDGKVKNKEIIEAIVEAERELRKKGGELEYRWVKGHSDSEGNIEADALAVRGSMMPHTSQP